jgi:hypothetical protein
MAKYRLTLTVEAESPEEAADKLFDEIYNSDDKFYIEADDLEELK